MQSLHILLQLHPHINLHTVNITAANIVKYSLLTKYQQFHKSIVALGKSNKLALFDYTQCHTFTIHKPKTFIMFNNRDQNEQRGHEDGPEYRSVMIQPLTAPTMPMRSFSPSPKLSKPTPTTTSINSNSNKTQDGAGSSSFPCRWIVQALSELPTDFLLVRTNVYVKDTASPQLIANRICNTLKTLSITIDSKTFEGEVSDTIYLFYLLMFHNYQSISFHQYCY